MKKHGLVVLQDGLNVHDDFFLEEGTLIYVLANGTEYETIITPDGRVYNVVDLLPEELNQLEDI